MIELHALEHIKGIAGLCSDPVTVIPGGIFVADDDGAVVLPLALAEQVIAKSKEHYEWENFPRMKLTEGAPLQRY